MTNLETQGGFFSDAVIGDASNFEERHTCATDGCTNLADIGLYCTPCTEFIRSVRPALVAESAPALRKARKHSAAFRRWYGD